MQAIKAAKLARAEAYQQALLDREQLPRMLRMLDLRLAGLLAEAAAATVGGAAAALHGAAPGLLHGAGADGCQGEGQEALGAGAAGSSGSPVFLCSVVMAEDGGIELSPGEEEWAAAVEGEVVGSSLRMAGSVPALLALPAFERYQALLEAAAVAGGSSEASAADAEAPAPPTDQQRQARLGAEELAKLDGSFVGGSAQLRALLGASFREARRAAQQFAEHAAVHRFGAEFDAAGWAASHASGQEGEADLAAADALLRQLAGWQDALQGMPLALDAGLVRLDASALQARLLVVVASAHDQVGALLTRAATERCRRLLEETGRWTEVAAARPPELDGFLAWRAEVARLEEGAGRQVAAAAQVEAALALLERFIGRLAAADAVKRDDLREAAAQLPAELAAAAAWAEGQRVVHGAAVAQQAKGVAEEAVVLESELQVGGVESCMLGVGWRPDQMLRGGTCRLGRATGIGASGAPTSLSSPPLPAWGPSVQAGLYVDVGSSAAEVMADLDLQRERMAQLRAQAEEAAAVGRELGGAGAGGEGEGEAGGDGVAWEVRDAEAALKVGCCKAGQPQCPAACPESLAHHLHHWTESLHICLGAGSPGRCELQPSLPGDCTARPHACSAAPSCGPWWLRPKNCVTACSRGSRAGTARRATASERRWHPCRSAWARCGAATAGRRMACGSVPPPRCWPATQRCPPCLDLRACCLCGA